MSFSNHRCHIGSLAVVILIASSLSVARAQTSSAEPANPVPADKSSIAAGRQLFMISCASCHGPDGKAQVQAMASAADLTHPEWFKRGGSDAAIFNSIQNGVGNAMPAHKGEIGESDTRKIITFIRSIQAPAKTH